MFYKVQGSLFRNTEFKEEDSIQINKEFRNKNILKAREEAFSYFQSVLEVLLESKGLHYVNDTQAVKCLTEFYQSNLKIKLYRHPGLSSLTYANDLTTGLSILFCTPDKPEYITKTGIKFYETEEIIRIFGHQSESFKNQIQENLIAEQKLIQK